MITLFKTGIAHNAPHAVGDVLNSGYIGEGDKVKCFETALAEHLEYPYIAAVNSATSALTLGLKMMDLPEGSQVLTSPMTCFASTVSILNNRLSPEWCDVNPRTMNICLSDVREKLSPKTRALMLVHWGGYPIDMDEIAEIKVNYARRFGRELYVIEDCAHSWGSTFKGKSLGTFGHYAAYSFGPIKSLTCGDGGLLLLPSKYQTERAKKLRWYGIDREDRDCDVTEIGFKYHMNDISAVIGLSNLEASKHFVRMHRRNAEYYDDNLRGVPGLKVLERDDRCDSSFWLYTLLVERRDQFVNMMAAHGIEAKCPHKRNDHYSCVQKFSSPLPRLDSIYKSVVCIPVGYWVNHTDRQHIVETIRKGW